MSTNARALTRYGIQFRWPPTKIPPGGIHADRLRDVYLTQLLALADIAEQADVSRSTIRRALAFNEIRLAGRQGTHPSTPPWPHPHPHPHPHLHADADRPGDFPAVCRGAELGRSKWARSMEVDEDQCVRMWNHEYRHVGLIV